MNVVMPPLLHFVQLKPDVTITSADDSDDDIDESDDERGSNVKADDQSHKSPEGVPPTYEDVVAPLFTLPIAWRVPKVLRPLYESPTILAQKTTMMLMGLNLSFGNGFAPVDENLKLIEYLLQSKIAKLPDDNKALDGLTKSKEAALLDAERTV
uniref:Uncharacterized protein n=1 Tax=Lactuca sativa TaxID=4236 RepID=A0A9R1V1H4_LACSA|nr:hypothetical protein LSAT_V11C700369680 [Lactuca sativa]